MEAIAQLRAADPQFFWSPKLAVQNVPGQGNSVVSVEPIGAGEMVIFVPAKMLVNVDTINEKCDGNVPLETHELLALELLRRRSYEDAWVMSMPNDFSFLPVLWPLAEQQELPERYRQTVANQLADIEAFAKNNDLNFSDAAWSWLAVNSRCLYWAKGGMTLAPGIDFLNHTDNQSFGLSVDVSLKGISATATHSYAPSTELTFCYGPRENGFLLAEYGFTMSPNMWEFVDVTEYVAPMVNHCKEFLESEGYYGDWTLNSNGEPSFRIEVALAAAQAPSLGPVKALINGYYDGQTFMDGTAKLVKKIVKSALEKSRAMQATVKNVQLRMLYEGYIQIMEKV